MGSADDGDDSAGRVRNLLERLFGGTDEARAGPIQVMTPSLSTATAPSRRGGAVTGTTQPAR